MALIFIAVLGVYQVLLLFVHAVVYKTLVAAFGWASPWLVGLFILLAISFTIASILAHLSSNLFIKLYYRASAYWFGLVHFLFIGAFIFYLLETIIYHFNYYISPAFLGELCFGVMFLIHAYATWQTTQPKFTKVVISLPNLPDFWRGKKIIFVSDLHLGAIWSWNFCAKIVAMIKAESPEMVLIGGDLFDGVRCYPESAIEPLAGLHLPQGVYYITGNHEYINRGIELFLESIKKSGIRILDNEVIELHGLQLAGVDWKDTRHAEDYRKILSGMAIDRMKPSILLKHEPSDLPIGEKAGFSLQLSGHTHRGQIFPLQLITRRVYRGFDYGLKKLGGMVVYTSSGVGTWGPPLRLGTKPEILEITLQ